MVQINLPQNSKVEKGKFFKDKTGSKNIRKVNIYRWDPSTGENPRIDTYEVDMDNCPSKVLDLLNKIHYHGVTVKRLKLTIDLFTDQRFQMMFNTFHHKKEFIDVPNKLTTKFQS